MPPKNPRKRRRSSSSHNTTVKKSRRKRFKTNTDTIVKSKLFTYCRDQKQFQELFRFIEKVNQYGLSKDVNKHIAEYTVGDIKYCTTTNCKVDIHILNAEKRLYHRNPKKYSEIVGWKYCGTTNKYMCEQCMKHSIDICPRCSKLCDLCHKSECHVAEIVKCGGCKLRICVDSCVEGDIGNKTLCYGCYWEN